MLPYLRLGPFLLPTASLALLIGLWAGLDQAEKESKRLKLNPAAVGNLIFYSLVAGIIGARLGYALQSPGAYLANPLGLLELTPTTLLPFAGVLIGLIAAAIFIQRTELPLRPTLDALAPGLALFMVAMGVAHLLNGEAYGAPARLPWAISLWNEYRHPSQVYEILTALVIFIIIWKRLPQPSGSGLNFVLVIFLSAAAQVFLEAFRGDSVIWPGGLRAAQVTALVIMLISFYWMRKWMNLDSASNMAPP